MNKSIAGLSILIFLIFGVALVVYMAQNYSTPKPVPTEKTVENIRHNFLHFDPENLSLAPGESKVILVKLNTADMDQVNAISAVIAYPTDLLTVTKINHLASAFDVVAEESSQSGVIKLSYGKVGNLSGDLNVATITVKAIKVGVGQLKFMMGSAAPRSVDSQDSLNLPSSKPAMVTITK